MQTRGETYQFQEGEKEKVAEINALLLEAYQKLKEAAAVAEGEYVLDMYWELDANGHPVLISNFSTPLRLNVYVDNEWMSSTQSC